MRMILGAAVALVATVGALSYVAEGLEALHRPLTLCEAAPHLQVCREEQP